MEGNEFLGGGRGLYKVKQGKLGKMYFLGGGCGSFEMMSRHNFATFFVFWNYEGLIAWKGNYLVSHRQGFWIFFAFRSQARYVHRTCIAKKEKEGAKYLSLLGVSLWHWARVQTPKISLFLLNYGGKISSYLKEKCSESVTSPRFPPPSLSKKRISATLMMLLLFTFSLSIQEEEYTQLISIQASSSFSSSFFSFGGSAQVVKNSSSFPFSPFQEKENAG